MNIEESFRTATGCYPHNYGLWSRLLLVPKSYEKEALTATACTLLHLPNKNVTRNAFIVGSNDTGNKLSYQLETVKILESDSPLLAVGDLMNKMKWSPMYTLIDTNANYDQVANEIKRIMDEDTNSVFIFCANLSEQVDNQEDSTMYDDDILSALQQGDMKYIDEEKSGCASLRVLVRLAKLLKIEKTMSVSCYSDTLGRRLGWSTKKLNVKVTSYAGCIWGSNPNDISPFDSEYLISYAHSCIVSKYEKSKMPEMPSWSPWHSINNGVYLGYDNIKSSERESIGNTIVDNILKAASKIYFRGDNIWAIRVYIDIVELSHKWLRVNPVRVAENFISPFRGYRLILPNGMASDYISPVDTKSMKFSDILPKLSIRAGGDPNIWINKNSVLSSYNIIRLNRCN